MKIYIINMDRDKDRLAFQEQQFKDVGLTFERHPPVLAAEMPVKKIEEAKKKWCWKRQPQDWEISLLYAHLALYEKIIEAGQPALILEDDAVMAADVPALLEKIEQLNFNGDFIGVEGNGKEVVANKKTQTLYENYQLVRRYIGWEGAAAYILYPSGAVKLLAFSKKYSLPADRLLATFLNKLNSFIVEPRPFVQDKSFTQDQSYNETRNIKEGGRVRSNKVRWYRTKKACVELPQKVLVFFMPHRVRRISLTVKSLEKYLIKK